MRSLYCAITDGCMLGPTNPNCFPGGIWLLQSQDNALFIVLFCFSTTICTVKVNSELALSDRCSLTRRCTVQSSTLGYTLSELDLCFNSVHLPLHRLWVQMGVWAVMMELLVSWHNLYKAGPNACSVHEMSRLERCTTAALFHFKNVCNSICFTPCFNSVWFLNVNFVPFFFFSSSFGVVLNGSVPFVFFI